MKKISIIVPVYNAEKWIEATLNSLIYQTYQNIEIICVDDGSTDNSCKIIEEKQKLSNNLILIKQENAGVCTARNNGLMKATGDYVAFLDADDYLDLDTYENLVKKLEEDNSDIIFCEFVRFWPNGKKQYTVEENFMNLVKNPQDIKYFLYSTESTVKGDTLFTKDIHGSVCRSIFLNEIIKKNKIKFHSNLKFAEDQVFILEYLTCVRKISYINKPYVWYRGATKSWKYHNLYENNMNLLNYQIKIVSNNPFYSEKEKGQIIGYLKCSTYFMIVNEEFMFKKDVVYTMKKYSKIKNFSKLLTLYNFVQKYKVRKDVKRIILFILLKLHMWRLVKVFYPNKKY